MSYHEQLTKQLTSDEVDEMQAEYQKETAQLKLEVLLRHHVPPLGEKYIYFAS